MVVMVVGMNNDCPISKRENIISGIIKNIGRTSGLVNEIRESTENQSIFIYIK